MPRTSRSRLNLSDEEKKKRRREQKKMSMRRARAKLDEAALEERRRKDRERYHRKKQDGLIKTIKDFTPRQQRQIRKMWREKSKLRREKEKIRKRTEIILNDTLPSSPSSSFSRIASGKAISARNRRRLKAKNEFLSQRMRILRLKKNRQQKQADKVSIKDKIHNFLLDDENSRLTAGKKDTITRRKVKKQIRLLNDTLLNLHKKFINNSGLNISYETFRRHRPFWVIFPTAASRNTCLCSTCTNNNYIVCALHHAKILPYSKASYLAKSLCCKNEPNVACLERRCVQCSEKKVDFNVINGSDTIIYERWITKNVEVTIKGQTRKVKKTIKERVKTSQLLLTNILKSNLPTYMQHLANFYNQIRAINFIKQNLTASDGLLHIDFSENYGCKYGTEIQSAHFGGSKGQISLHTCVFYSKDSQSTIKASCFCTVSQDLRHDPVLICAHLKPVIEQIKLIIPDLKDLHILSDGPTTQYGNKTMFQMIVNYISKISSVESITWHFSESGHGKGAPDGVGGCLKRTCDKAVGNGRDIIDLNTFVDCTKVNCKGIMVMPIDDSVVSDIQNIADAITVPPFKGTFKIHQITWTTREPNILHVRRLSCIVCAADTKCPHFEMGLITVQTIQLPGTSTSSTSEDCMPSPVPLSPGTASASTVTGPRTPVLYMETPSPDPILNVRQPLTPKKRVNFEDIYSDDSVSVTPDKIFRPVILDDSDGEISPPYRSNPRLGFFNDGDGENVSPKKSKKRLAFFGDNNEENLPPKIPKRPAATSDESDEDIF
ncbi:hypothetical protein ABMA27_010747 [Loxostege sticticalis]|uniref:SWIM-type domain-containing protein n=1 Tax=Loxostege sticticalis TaxID=481309 RepID=A0ABR3H4V9_LOXSC